MAEDRELLKEIYTLVAQMKTVNEALNRIETNVRLDLDRAAQGRSALYQKMEELTRKTDAHGDELVDMQKTLVKVQTVTDDVTRWKLMGMGALAVTGLAASALTTIVIYFGQRILHAIWP